MFLIKNKFKEEGVNNIIICRLNIVVCNWNCEIKKI